MTIRKSLSVLSLIVLLAPGTGGYSEPRAASVNKYESARSHLMQAHLDLRMRCGAYRDGTHCGKAISLVEQAIREVNAAIAEQPHH